MYENKTEIIHEVTKRKFNLIYNAAKKRDAHLIKEVYQNYLAAEKSDSEYALSIRLNGHTPISLLAYEGDYDSVRFLISQGGKGDEASFGCAHRSDIPPDIPDEKPFYFFNQQGFIMAAMRLSIKMANPHYKLGLMDDKLELEPNTIYLKVKNKKINYSVVTSKHIIKNKSLHIEGLDLDEETISLDKLNAYKEKIVRHIAETGDIEPQEEIDINDILNKVIIFISSYALLGQVEKVNELLIGSNYRHITDLYYTELAAYCYGFVGYIQGINSVWKNAHSRARALLIQGCLEGGHLKPFETLLNKTYLYDVVAMNLLSFESPSNLRHSDILLATLAHIHDPILRKIVHDKIINERTMHLHPSTKNMLHNSTRINHHITNYELNFEQALVCSRPETLIWLLQGMQLVYQGKLNGDLLIKILAYTLDSPVSEVYLSDLFQKVYLSIHKNLLIHDLIHYLSGFYKINRYHTQRAESFKHACENATSIPDLKTLIKNQYSLFFTHAKSSSNSKVKHERPVIHAIKDEFVDILEKHIRRI